MSDVALEELCSLIVDSEHKTAPKDPEGLHPLVRTGNLGRARADLSSAQRVNSETYMHWTKRAKPMAGDLILAREAPVGGVFCISEGEEPVLGQRTVLLRPDPSKVDGRFLMYRLASDDLQARMSEMSTGSTVPHLNMSDIRKFIVPRMPSLHVQHRVANVLSALDQLIEINSRKVTLLESLARSLYQAWFVRFRFPENRHQELTKSHLGPIPRGWAVRSIGEIAEAVRGRSYRRSELAESGGMPFLNLKCVARGGGFRRDGLKRYRGHYKEDQRVTPGDVLVAITDMTQERRVVAQAFRMPELNEEFAIPSLDLVLLKPVLASMKIFLYATLRFSGFANEVRQFANGANVLHLSVERILEHQVLTPDSEIIGRFSQTVEPMLAACDLLETQNEVFSSTRDLLLSRLVTGQLDISDIDLGTLTPTEVA